MDAHALVALAHGACLRALCARDARHYQGLAQAARTSRIASALRRKLIRLDTAFNITRHITKPYIEALVDSVEKLDQSSRLEPVDPWQHGQDPWSVSKDGACFSVLVPFDGDVAAGTVHDIETQAHKGTVSFNMGEVAPAHSMLGVEVLERLASIENRLSDMVMAIARCPLEETPLPLKESLVHPTRFPVASTDRADRQCQTDQDDACMEVIGDDIPVVGRWRACKAIGASYRPFGRLDSIFLAAGWLHFTDCPLHTGRCICAERCFQCVLGRVPDDGAG